MLTYELYYLNDLMKSIYKKHDYNHEMNENNYIEYFN